MIGNIIIKPSSAILTREVSPKGSMDPYAKVIFGFQSSSTKVALGADKTPEWKDMFSFARTNEDEIQIEIWDKNTVVKDTLVGTAVVPFFKVVYHQNSLEEWVPLIHSGKEVGKVLVEVEFRPEGKVSFGDKYVDPPFQVYGAWAFGRDSGSSFGDFGTIASNGKIEAISSDHKENGFPHNTLDPSQSGI